MFKRLADFLNCLVVVIVVAGCGVLLIMAAWNEAMSPIPRALLSVFGGMLILCGLAMFLAEVFDNV